jgi:hypothetical protein
MELSQGLSRQESLLIGLEEIYQEELFPKLRRAMMKEGERQRLYEILTVASETDASSASFLVKMREALDRYQQEDFWTWLSRALGEMTADTKAVEVFNRAFKKDEALDFNLGMFEILDGPYQKHRELLRALHKALESRDGFYCNEALKIFEAFEGPAFLLLQRVRKSLQLPDSVEGALQLLSGLEYFYRWDWVHRLKLTIGQYAPDFQWDCLSRSQIQSKKWAIEKIHHFFGPEITDVHIMCGWYGLLGTLMLQSGRFENLKIRSFDKDPLCAPIADELNRPWLADGWQFKAFTADAYKLDYGADLDEGVNITGPRRVFRQRIQLMINTSCEHMPDVKAWLDLLPPGTPLLLQSNNGFGEEGHMNCVEDLEHFKKIAPLSRTLFAGELDCGAFTRFMLLGYK